MGASRIKTYITRNRWISSPFTNIFTKSVVYPEPWLKFPRLERHAIFAHEFTHERTKKRFAFEILIVIIAAFVFPYAIFFLGRPGIPIIAEIGEFALAVLALSQVSWRNEYRADLGAARIVSPEAMISVLETLQAQADWDGSSLTHPPLSSRIKRLQKLLDSPNGS
jgi:Zn-dependent protease with chaperone function